MHFKTSFVWFSDQKDYVLSEPNDISFSVTIYWSVKHVFHKLVFFNLKLEFYLM